MAASGAMPQPLPHPLHPHLSCHSLTLQSATHLPRHREQHPRERSLHQFLWNAKNTAFGLAPLSCNQPTAAFSSLSVQMQACVPCAVVEHEQPAVVHQDRWKGQWFPGNRLGKGQTGSLAK
eukprot:749203-Rhodomonas_salina.1